MGTTQSDLMTAEEVAALLGVKVTTVNTWAKSGTIRGIKINKGIWRFWRKDVMAALGNGPKP